MKGRTALAAGHVSQSSHRNYFDDSFSALDLKTDAALRRALAKKVADGILVIIVAQRISTILHADQILVLNDGRIVGGTDKGCFMAVKLIIEIVILDVIKSWNGERGVCE